MARRHGRNGRLYASITSGGSAESIAFLQSWTIDAATDRIDVTAMGDTTKTYVAGLPDAKGTYAGFYDDSTAQLFTAAADGVARKFYLYPDAQNTPGQYFFGTAFFDQSTAGGVTDAVKINGNWSAATPIQKVG